MNNKLAAKLFLLSLMAFFQGMALVHASVAPARTFDDMPLSATYADVKVFLQQLVATYPKTTQLFTLDVSDSGDIIQGVIIGDGNPANIHNLLVSTHHGNEYGSTEVAKAFALALAQQPIAGQTLYVIPVLNINGFDNRNRAETLPSGEEVDPNRDYPGPCGTDGPFKLKSTHALADFIDHENIVTSATLHTFYPVVAYPWGISTEDVSTLYDAQFIALAQAAVVESKYPVGNSTLTIYPADGCYEDYAFWKHGIWSLLFELGDTHTPSDEEVHLLQSVNVPGMMRMFEQAPKQRADHHSFDGKCDARMPFLDQHNE